MMRRESEKVLKTISLKGGSHLPCPKRKNRAMVATEVCQSNCRWARNCTVFRAWQRPGLDLFGLGSAG
jgi:hypothetical protein